MTPQNSSAWGSALKLARCIIWARAAARQTGWIEDLPGPAARSGCAVAKSTAQSFPHGAAAPPNKRSQELSTPMGRKPPVGFGISGFVR